MKLFFLRYNLLEQSQFYLSFFKSSHQEVFCNFLWLFSFFLNYHYFCHIRFLVISLCKMRQENQISASIFLPKIFFSTGWFLKKWLFKMSMLHSLTFEVQATKNMISLMISFTKQGLNILSSPFLS